MKNLDKVLFILPFVALIVFSSCEKFTGDTSSISGVWRCYEDSQDGSKQYSASIFRAGEGYDTSYYIINNFHDLGAETETLVQLKDTIVTIKLLDGYSVAGQGYVRRNFKEIYWVYNISGSLVTAQYIKK